MKSYLEAALIGLLTIFAPIKSMVIATFVLVIGDLITGVLAARKRGEPITSAGLRRTISKLALFEFALAAAFLGEHYLLADSFPTSKLVAATIGLTESTSLFENINELAGNNMFKGLVQKLGSVNDERKSDDAPKDESK